MYLPNEHKIWVGTNAARERMYLEPRMANRHGIIAGATGTGKTVTLKVLAESFSDMGTSVFLVDVKGDVSGLLCPGEMNENITGRVQSMGIEGFTTCGYPVRFFDVYGKKGIPVRTTVSDMGPDLLARIMELTQVQTEVLSVVFKIADDNGWLLIDTKDLRAMLQYAGENAKQFMLKYGSLPSQTIAAIQRNIVHLEANGGEIFFGEPALDIADWLDADAQGRGVINLLHSVELIQNPLLYSAFLLWMLGDLYERLPEAGDLPQPKLVFFFDEAHLLFGTASKTLLSKVEQVARLIRSKGVGIYFITQSPSDIPDTVLAQLGNKIQHALRAYTPKEQKAVKAAAQGFRTNPAFDSETALGELGTGEALVSFLDQGGIPSVVERAKILPPRSLIAPSPDITVRASIDADPLFAKYAESFDRESAYELLVSKREQEVAAAEHAAREAQLAAEEADRKAREAKEAQKAADAAAKEQQKAQLEAQRLQARAQAEAIKLQAKAEADQAKQRAKAISDAQKAEEKRQREAAAAAKKRQQATARAVGSFTGTVGRQIGKEIIRGIFGGRR
ncbi:MAG: DUF853 domain-containing protein [Lachnospiraceae bacterium]|jgi:DNA helicase HerA-like ATPase|nr:DUF853 domain-containing protein [Lachnospiraceae bacterium]